MIKAIAFDLIGVLASEIGKIKPNVDFYQHILDKFKIKKEELLFLDDNKYNIEGA